MADSALALFSMGALFGMILSLFILAFLNSTAEKKDERMDKDECNNDSDVRVYIFKRDRGRSSNN